MGYRETRNGVSVPLDWVLCLAADVDQGLDKLSLEIISEQSNADRWLVVTNYVKTLLNGEKNTGKLGDLVESRTIVTP